MSYLPEIMIAGCIAIVVTQHKPRLGSGLDISVGPMVSHHTSEPV